jgi:hypothetical protein
VVVQQVDRRQTLVEVLEVVQLIQIDQRVLEEVLEIQAVLVDRPRNRAEVAEVPVVPDKHREMVLEVLEAQHHLYLELFVQVEDLLEQLHPHQILVMVESAKENLIKLV